MATDTPVQEFLDRLGPQGNELAWTCGNEISNLRGYHVQECISVCLCLGYTATPIQLMPQIAAPFTSIESAIASVSIMPIRVLFGPDETSNWLRFINQLDHSRGVIEGFSTKANCGHAVAYDHGRIFDPDGHEYNYSRDDMEKRGFYTSCLWRVDQLRTT